MIEKLRRNGRKKRARRNEKYISYLAGRKKKIIWKGDIKMNGKTYVKKFFGRRSIFLCLLVIATVCMVFSNVSASISPDHVTKTLYPGDCYTVTKTVTIPGYTPKADVVFSFDLTGSMGSIINAAKTKAIVIMNTLITNYPGVSFNFGVMSYMDYPHTYSSCGYSATYGSSTDYAYSLDQSLTFNVGSVSSAINGLVLGSGWDGPQDYTRIFYESYADPSVGWRTGAKRLLVNFGDNVPHDCNLNQGVTSGTWTTGLDPGRDEVIFTGDDLDLQSVLSAMASPSNAVTLIECHTSTYANSHWIYWTGITGGSVFITSSGNLVNDVVNAVVSGITIPTVNNLHLAVITPGYSSWLSSVVPPSYATVNPGDTVTFQETICVPLGTPCGIHTFTVSAVDGSGVSYGDQINEITIPCDEIPPITTKEHGPGCIMYDPAEDVWYMQPCNPIYLYARDDHPDATGVQFLHYELWWDPDCDGVYDFLKFSVYVFDNDPNDLNPAIGEIDVELHIDQECCHKLIWYSVDNADNQEEPHEQFYRMDGTPPNLYKEHPEHGYYPIDPPILGYLKCCAPIELWAEDPGLCASGVEGIYWGFTYSGVWHPIDTSDTYGGNTVSYYKNGKWWFVYNDAIKIHFTEECIHTLEYWTKDNICNQGPIYTQTYYVDNTPPTITKTHPPSYIEIDPEPIQTGWIKLGDEINIEAEDQGTFPCIAGVENQFWRYEYDGISYPLPSEPGAIDGATLGVLYGYTDPEIIGYWWYVDDDDVDILLGDPTHLGKHDLYYWAKDNVCNRGTIHHQIYWVNTCQPEVWVDDNFHSGTPGWWITHFYNIQTALDWLEPGGIAHIHEGVYNENIVVDDVPWCDNTGITIEGINGCPPLPTEDSAVIDGTIQIKVNGVTINNLVFEPTTDAAVTVEGNTDITLRCNIFLMGCDPDSVGVNAKPGSDVDARQNWWGDKNGPNGGLMNDDSIANGMGVQIFGTVYVEQWIGVHAEATASSYSVETGEPIVFNGGGSFARNFDGPYEPEYYWTFEPTMHSNEKVSVYVFDTPGTYKVTLRVQGNGITYLHDNFMFDFEYLTIEVTSPTSTLSANAGGGEFGVYEVNVGESVQLFGSATGGKQPYSYSWNLDGEEVINEQNPMVTYENAGTYIATLKVTDDNGDAAIDTAEVIVLDSGSDEDDDTVEIKDMKGGFLFTANIKTTDVSAEWSITIDGSIFFGGQNTGVTPANTEETVKLPFSLGIGRVDITVTANSVTKEATAFMLGPFILSVKEV
jgi:PKD repeat protein